MTRVNFKGVKALVLLLVMISTSFHAWQLGIQRNVGLLRRLPFTSLKESAVAYSEVDVAKDKKLKGSASKKKGPLTQIDVAVSTVSGGAGGVKGRRRTNVGRKHTEESKAKIARANKGKRPWNAGKKHSEETKARIAERTRSAMMARKQAKLDAMGMTLEEYNESRATQLKEKRKAKAKGGLTLEGRKRISESVKKRWEDPEYRKKYTLANRGNRNHSAETKAKISAAIKAKWEDDAYRAKVNTSSHRPSQEVRDRISRTLKAKWQDPEFRSKMLQNSHERNDEWKEKVSGKIKALWKDPEYRNNVQQGIINSSSSRSARGDGGDGDSGSGAAGGRGRRTAAAAPRKRKPSAVKKTGAGVKKAAAAAGKASGAAAGSKAAKSSTTSLDFRRRLRVFALGEIKRAVHDLSSRSGGSATSSIAAGVDSTEKATATVVSASSIKAVLGPELWFEEKMLRRHTHTPPHSEAPLMDDGELGAALLAEMSVYDGGAGAGAVLSAGTSTATAVRQMVMRALAREEAVDWATAMKKAAKAGAKTAAGTRGRSSRSSSSSSSSSKSSHSSEQALAAGGSAGTSANTALASAGELTHAVAVDERFGVSNEDYDGENDDGWSEEDEDDEDDNYAAYDDDDEHGHEQDEDVIEVYDESGTLVGTYTDEEWARMKGGR
jgi:hypothetical protein